MAPSEAAAADDGPFGGPSGVSDDEWLADASPGPGVGSMPLGPPDAAGTESMMHGAHASVDGEGFTHGIADPISAAGSTNGEADRPSTPPPGTDGQDNDWLGGAPTPSDFAPENPDGWSSLDNSFASKPPPSPLGPKLAAVGADADASWTEHRASPFGGTDSPQKAPAEVAAHRPADMMGMMPPVNVTSQPQQTFVVKKASSLGDLFGGGGTDLDDGAYVSPVAASTNPFDDPPPAADDSGWARVAEWASLGLAKFRALDGGTREREVSDAMESVLEETLARNIELQRELSRTSSASRRPAPRRRDSRARIAAECPPKPSVQSTISSGALSS